MRMTYANLHRRLPTQQNCQAYWPELVAQVWYHPVRRRSLGSK